MKTEKRNDKQKEKKQIKPQQKQKQKEYMGATGGDGGPGVTQSPPEWNWTSARCCIHQGQFDAEGPAAAN